MELPNRNSPKEEQRASITAEVERFSVGAKGWWGVYTLQCEQPVSDDEMKERLSSHYTQYPVRPSGPEYGPDWTKLALQANELYYVGQSNKVVDRILKHLSGDGALFAELFPPISIENIDWCESEEAAKKLETQTSKEISQSGGTTLDSSLDMMFVDLMKTRIKSEAGSNARHLHSNMSDVTKGDVFERWLSEFENSFSGFVDELQEAAHRWGAQSTFEPPSDADRSMENATESSNYWKRLSVDQTEKRLSEIEVHYKAVIEENVDGPITFAYSM